MLFTAANGEDTFLMAWTTTPWTLPSNLGLTVGPDIDYVMVCTYNPYTFLRIQVVLAEALLGKFFKSAGENAPMDALEYVVPADNKNAPLPWKITGRWKGSELEGIRYEQLLPSGAASIEKIRSITPDADPFRVVCGDFVTTGDGTGIVHTAPAFGADDFRMGQKNKLGILTLVDRQGKFVEGLGEFSGRYVKNYTDDPAYADVNVDICVKLKKENRAFRVEKYEHSYPHCWRTDKPIIYYPLDAWFIRTTAVKERMIEHNATIRWKPAATGTGRFGNWLENMVDWNLSRSRFWGTPLPIWKTVDEKGSYIEEEDGGEVVCIASMAALQEAINTAAVRLGGDTNKRFIENGLTDLHKPYVDEIVLVSSDGKPMRRVPDLIDVWFDSGAMPYAQWGLPEKRKGIVPTAEECLAYWKTCQGTPSDKQDWSGADFIAEGVDQTRGWFYTLHALAVLLFDGVAYQTVVSNGLVLDKNGNKMSKRLGNVVDPFATINSFGPDATRWYLITNASPWDSLKFDAEGIKEVQRKFFGTLYNTYQFFALYANLDGFSYSEPDIPVEERSELDRWILSALHSLIARVEENMDAYEPTQAGREIEDFVDRQLSNWYVRLSRRRFWKGEYGHDKICAYQTLYECLEKLAQLTAPIAPFFADWLFGNLNAVSHRLKESSVHHTFFPGTEKEKLDAELEEKMTLAQEVSSLILSLRKKVNIKVRQPLKTVFIPALDEGMGRRIREMESVILSETNIRSIELLDAGNDFIKKKAKANFKTLGKKLGPQMKAAADAIARFGNAEIDRVLAGEYMLELAGSEPISLGAEDLDVITDEIPGFEVAGRGNITVALDIVITPDLKEEGDAREFVNKMQHLRKEKQLAVSDRIDVKVLENRELQPALIHFKDYICAEILADSLSFSAEELPDSTEIDVNDAILTVMITKKGGYNGNH
jgi:isoleucyl-tRNA synthetase